jgi:hypothetical protein
MEHFEQHADSLQRSRRRTLQDADEARERSIDHSHPITRTKSRAESYPTFSIGPKADHLDERVVHRSRTLGVSEHAANPVGPSHPRKVSGSFRQSREEVAGEQRSDTRPSPSGPPLRDRREEHLASQVADPLADERLLARMRMDDVPIESPHALALSGFVAASRDHTSTSPSAVAAGS